jgi:hypothetical protein
LLAVSVNDCVPQFAIDGVPDHATDGVQPLLLTLPVQ